MSIQVANAIAVILVAVATALAHWRIGKHAAKPHQPTPPTPPNTPTQH